ncbi:MAG: hypothetical protein AAB403_10060 [Planctomycetota bacterium]
MNRQPEVPPLFQRVKSLGVWAVCFALLAALQTVEAGYDGRAWAQTEKDSQTSPAFVEYEIKGRRYRVPEKYLSIPPRADQLGRVNRTQGQFGFAFWLSDGKPSQTRLLSLNTFWPTEAGRSAIGDQDFVVQVVSVTYVPPKDEANEVLPSKKLHNSLIYLAPAPERTEDVAFGLLRYTLVRPGEHLVVAATPSGSDPDVLLRSSWIERHWPRGRPPNPFWRTSVFSKADGLLIELRIPEIALGRWSDVVCQTLTLVRSWEVPPSQQRQGCVTPRVASTR